MRHEYQTIKMLKPKAIMWMKLFEMWCKDNDITKVTCELSKGGKLIIGKVGHSTKRVQVSFQQPQDALLFQLNNNVMWRNFEKPVTASLAAPLVAH